MANPLLDRNLIRHWASQSALLFGSCGLALFSFAWVRVWVVSLLDLGQFETILDQFRDFEKFAPVKFDALLSYSGRVGMTFDEPIVILCTVVWCISRGSDAVSGQLGRGTMEMLMGQPTARRTVILSHASVSIIGLLLLCLLVWAGIGVGVAVTEIEETVPVASVRIPFTTINLPLESTEPVKQVVALSDRVDCRLYSSSVFSLFAFGFFLLGLSTLFSSFDQYRWRTIGFVVGVYVIQLVIFGLGKAAESLDWLLSFTFFSCYKPQPTSLLAYEEGLGAAWRFSGALPDFSLPPVWYPLILIAAGVLFYLIAIHRFERRDLPAPL
ncbi:MAG: ABC transporter permease subunit [Planctomycetota bacterium]